MNKIAIIFALGALLAGCAATTDKKAVEVGVPIKSPPMAVSDAPQRDLASGKDLRSSGTIEWRITDKNPGARDLKKATEE